MNLAWMISRDGKAIQTKMHPYIDLELPEETLYSAEWLYNNTSSGATKQHIAQLVCSFIREGAEDEDLSYKDFIDQTLQYAREDGLRICSAGFLENFIDKVDATSGDFDTACEAVQNDLNQEFLRARYGGMYDTSQEGQSGPTSNGIYFRVSSTNFDWLPIIYDFVSSNRKKLNIQDISIVRDNYFKAKDDFYVNPNNGEPYDRYPVDQFLTDQRAPLIEFKTYRAGGPLAFIAERLKAGVNPSDIYCDMSVPLIRFNRYVRQLHHDEVLRISRRELTDEVLRTGKSVRSILG